VDKDKEVANEVDKENEIDESFEKPQKQIINNE
jgi:hypothetical protein